MAELTEVDVEALVRDARAGDTGALGQLYDIYRDRVARFATGRLGDAEKAEDVTSETFEAVCRNLASSRPGTDFEAWLFTIAHRRPSLPRPHPAAGRRGEGRPNPAPARSSGGRGPASSLGRGAAAGGRRAGGQAPDPTSNQATGGAAGGAAVDAPTAEGRADDDDDDHQPVGDSGGPGRSGGGGSGGGGSSGPG
jgi:Sigma-70 region 2